MPELSSWPDGSVKWHLVHFQADLPGNHDKTFRFGLEPDPPSLMPKLAVNLTEEASGISVNTGPLSFLVPREGFLPLRELELAARQFAALLETPIGFAQEGKYLDDSGAVIAGVGRGRIFADKYTSILLWAAAATPLGLLDWYDYPCSNH